MADYMLTSQFRYLFVFSCLFHCKVVHHFVLMCYLCLMTFLREVAVLLQLFYLKKGANLEGRKIIRLL